MITWRLYAPTNKRGYSYDHSSHSNSGSTSKSAQWVHRDYTWYLLVIPREIRWLVNLGKHPVLLNQLGILGMWQKWYDQIRPEHSFIHVKKHFNRYSDILQLLFEILAFFISEKYCMHKYQQLSLRDAAISAVFKQIYSIAFTICFHFISDTNTRCELSSAI